MITAIIQARMDSTRLPGKVLMPICGKPMLWWIHHRLTFCRRLEQIVVATSTCISDNPIHKFCDENNIMCYRGALDDLFSRYLGTAAEYNADPIIRVTGDCPFVTPSVVDELIKTYLFHNYSYVSVCAGVGSADEPKQYPDGLDAEIFSYTELDFANGLDFKEREHFTKYFWGDPATFPQTKLRPHHDYSDIKLSVDTVEEFRRVSKIYHEWLDGGHGIGNDCSVVPFQFAWEVL